MIYLDNSRQQNAIHKHGLSEAIPLIHTLCLINTLTMKTNNC